MKIAFCFLCYNDIEQKSRWENFFDGVSLESYSIFLHRKDTIKTSWAPNCTIIPTRVTSWASFSLVEVQQDLLNEAYKDPLITKFILLSGDSIPITSFKELYTRLMSDTKGFLEYEDCKNASHKSRESSVNPSGWPSDMPWKWRVASQWAGFNRFHVQQLQENWDILEQTFNTSVVPDEHIYVVFFNGIHALDTFHKSNLIYINWSSPSKKCKISHNEYPKTYHTHELSQIDTIREKGYYFMRKICTTVVC
jgi:hypothetical protein